MKNVKKLIKSTATTANATNETDTIALHLDLQQFVGLAVDYTIALDSMVSLSMAMKPFLARYIAAGYTTISSGPKGKGQAPKPKANELSYTELKGLFDDKCASHNPPIVYSKEATASGKSSYSNAINQFVQNFKLALTTGEWGSGNSSRDKKAIETTAEPKAKVLRGAKTEKTIDVAKIAERLNKELNEAQTIALMELLCSTISDKNKTYKVVKQ